MSAARVVAAEVAAATPPYPRARVGMGRFLPRGLSLKWLELLTCWLLLSNECRLSCRGWLCRRLCRCLRLCCRNGLRLCAGRARCLLTRSCPKRDD